MITKIIKEDELYLAVDALKNGDVIAFPTETVYGLAANAFDEKAVKKIYQIKGRPNDNPLIVHISDTTMLESVAKDIPAIAYELLAKFSPGPLTLILKKSDKLASGVSKLSTVGIRIPSHLVALRLIKESGLPLAAPSANISTRVSATRSQYVYDDLVGKINYIVDGGDCLVGIESTILDLTKPVPTILRPGSITAKDLLSVLSKVKIKDDVILVAEAPGMMYQHYAPLCEAILANDLTKALNYYQQNIHKKPVIVALGENVDNYEFISLGSNIIEAQKRYYQVLREAEKQYGLIIIVRVSEDNNSALMNRILKSANNQVIL